MKPQQRIYPKRGLEGLNNLTELGGDVFAFQSLWRVKFASSWTLLPLRIVIGVGFMAHGLTKWNRGPAKFGLLLQHTGRTAPFSNRLACYQS